MSDRQITLEILKLEQRPGGEPGTLTVSLHMTEDQYQQLLENIAIRTMLADRGLLITSDGIDGIDGLAPLELVQMCRVCGCTDDDCSECMERTGEPCYWVEPGLCSACGGDTAQGIEVVIPWNGESHG